MKQIASLLLGVLLIIFSNTILNFTPFDPKIEPLLIYIIILSLYSKQSTYFLLFLAFLLGFFQDASIGIFSASYTILFLVIMLFGTYIKDKVIKEYFGVPFFITFVIVIFSVIYFNIITAYPNVLSVFVDNALVNLKYITKTMICISIIILIINKIIDKLEN